MADLVRLGTTAAGEALVLDPRKMGRTFIQGASGSGKSRTIRRMLEITYGKRQHIVLDVEDEFYTLRGAGRDYLILGSGQGAAQWDAPTSVRLAGAHARMILESGVNAILELNDLGLDGQEAYIAAFLDALMTAPQDLWHPALIVIDEAQRYAPEGGGAMSHDAIVNLGARGRKRDFAAIFASFSISSFSKRVLGNCPNKMIGRVEQDLDKRRGGDLLGFRPSSPEAIALLNLEEGMFWCMGPALARPSVLAKIDPSETAHIEPGAKPVPTPAPEQMRALLAQFRARAEEEARGEGAQEAGGAPAAERIVYRTDPAEIEAVRARAWGVGRVAGYAEGMRDALERVSSEFGAMLDRLSPGPRPARLEEPEIAPSPPAEPSIGADGSLPVGEGPNRPPRPAAPAAVRDGAAEDEPLTNPQRKVIAALKWWRAMGKDAPTRAQIAAIVGWKPRGTNLKDRLSELHRKGLVAYPAPSAVSLTPAGEVEARAVGAPTYPSVLAGLRAGALTNPQAKVVDALIALGGGPVSRKVLAAKVGWEPEGTNLKDRLAELRRLAVVDYPGPSRVELQPWVRE